MAGGSPERINGMGHGSRPRAELENSEEVMKLVRPNNAHAGNDSHGIGGAIKSYRSPTSDAGRSP